MDFEQKLEKIKHIECDNCGRDMNAVFDKIANKYTGHSWECECMPGVILHIGSGN